MYCSYSWILNTVVIEDYNPSSAKYQKWAPKPFDIVVKTLLDEQKIVSTQLFGWAANIVIRDLKQSKAKQEKDLTRFFRIRLFLDPVPMDIQLDPERLDIYSRLYASLHEEDIKQSIEFIKNVIHFRRQFPDNRVFQKSVETILKAIPFYGYLDENSQGALSKMQTHFLNGGNIVVANKKQAEWVQTLSQSLSEI